MALTHNCIFFLAALFQLFKASEASNGAFVSFSGNPLSDPWITYVRTSLVLPKAPVPQVNSLTLGPALYTTSEYGQGVVQTCFGSLVHQPCPGTSPEQWCVEPTYFNASLNKYVTAPTGTASAGAAIGIEYIYNYVDGSYTQIAMQNQKTLSYGTHGVGGSWLWAPTVLCGENSTGIMPAHTYWNTTIILSYEMPKFDKTFQSDHGNITNMQSVDGGKTWSIEQIHLGAAYCGPNNTANSNAVAAAHLTGPKINNATIAVPMDPDDFIQP